MRSSPLLGKNGEPITEEAAIRYCDESRRTLWREPADDEVACCDGVVLIETQILYDESKLMVLQKVEGNQKTTLTIHDTLMYHPGFPPPFLCY
jgi:hypothetical protein